MKFFILCKNTHLGSKKMHGQEEINEKIKKPFENPTIINHKVESNTIETEEKQDVEKNKNKKHRVIDKSQFRLPNVKELAKQFTKEDNQEIKTRHSYTKLENKTKNQTASRKNNPEQVPEVDYSTIPVSEIILHLQKAAESPKQDANHKDILYNHIEPLPQMEICRKVDSKIIIENRSDGIKKTEKIDTGRFNGKEVHSLTARSISKEFREGLKNNSYQKNCHKIDRSSSGGESDHGDIVCSKVKPSPMPSVDLKNMKKFWEEVIIANSNSTKQK